MNTTQSLSRDPLLSRAYALLAFLLAASLLLQPLAAALPAWWNAWPPAPLSVPVPAVQTATATGVDTVAWPAAPTARTYPFALPAEVDGKAEVMALRTVDSVTFDMGDGTFALLQDTLPLHYADADGLWQPIDTAFVAVPEGWLNATNLLHTALARTDSAAVVGTETLGVRWEPQALEWVDATGRATTIAATGQHSATAKVSADRSAVRYGGHWSLADVQDQWQIGRGSAEYTLRLPSLPQPAGATPQSLDLRARLHLRPGTTLHVNGVPVTLPVETADALTFVGPDGVAMDLLPPQAYEQGDRAAMTAGRYVLSATADPAVVELRVRLPWAWLAAAERQFPVIIDPLFQMRTSTQRRTLIYSYPPGGSITPSSSINVESVAVGRLGDLVYRGLVRFDIPRLPPGSTISKAYLVGIPKSTRPLTQMKVTVHPVTSPFPWWQDSGVINVTFGDAIVSNPEVAKYSAGEPTSPVLWDVSPIASGWVPGIQTNNQGLLLKIENEGCTYNDYFDIKSLFGCFAFVFKQLEQPASWELYEMEYTAYRGNEASPYVLDSEGDEGGLRLLVYYTAATLTENVTVQPQYPDSNVPKGNTDPYFWADHVYNVPTMPTNRWQAIVARSRGAPQGPQNPNQPGINNAHRVYLNGSIPLSLRTLQYLELRGVSPAEETPGYILLNGRGTVAQNQNWQLRVSNSTGTPAPFTYDVRLIRETGGITTTVGVERVINYTFDSANPLALWNLSLPAGSNTQVRLKITGDGTRPASYATLFADDFQANIYRSTSQSDLPTSLPGDPYRAKPSWQLAYNATRSSEIFNVQSGQYALALSYSGPQLTVWDEIECGKEFCNSEVTPIQYNVEVRVLSCQPGWYPTQGGTCQKIECPSTSTYVGNSTTFRSEGLMGLWSKAGWTGTTSNAGDVAPMLGPDSNTQAPRIAALGGTITYNSSTDAVSLSSNTTAMLVQCPAPTGSASAPTAVFSVFMGAMARGTTGLITPVMRPSPAGSGQILADPWLNEDKSDLTLTDFYLQATGTAPGGGTARGAADLRRRIGTTDVRTLNFTVTWEWNATGWASLTSTAAAKQGNPAPPTIASLILSLGTNLAMDAKPFNSANYRQFTALRASTATISQQVSMGGATKPLQAVILPRTWPVQEIDASCPHSCLDLRAPDDDPSLINPRRTWEMPDVHTNVSAGTVMMQSEGQLVVYSTDHPSQIGSPADFSQEYSFDAYKATVSVVNEPCKDGEASTLVIKGETRMALPNIGDTSGNPDAAIAAGFKLCETPPNSGDPQLRNVHLSFQSPIGIPIGNSGLFLTKLGGTIDINPDYTNIELDLSFQAAPGGNGGVFKASGKVIIDTRGLFAFQGTGKVLAIVDVHGSAWVAWRPLDIGFDIGAEIADGIIQGQVRGHLWEGQGWQNRYPWLPDNDEMHMAGEFDVKIVLPEGFIVDWELLTLPPDDITLLGILLAFGQFCTNNSCTQYEWGVKGVFTIIGYDVGLYYGFDEGLDLILGNDDHVLIDEYGGSQLLRRDLSDALADKWPRVLAAPRKVDGTATVPITVSVQAEQILVGLSWQAGAPSLTLVDPDGVEITPANVGSHNGQSAITANSVLITLQQPKPGAWQAKLGNLSAEGIEHYKFMYLANKGAPGTPGDRGRFLKPQVANEPGTGSYTVTWEAPADTPATATISLFYYRTTEITGTLEMGVPIVQNLPYITGSYTWNTAPLLNGSYRIRAVVDDGINDLPSLEISQPDDTCQPAVSGLPSLRAFDTARFPGTIVFESPGTVQVLDQTPPAAPTGLALSIADGAIRATWNAAPEPDVTAYLVRWGPRFGAGFIVQNQQLVTAAEEPALRIGAVNAGLMYGVNLLALDANGNMSALSAAQFTQPIGSGEPVPLAPTNLAVTGVDSTSASFTWAPPSAGPTPAGYRLTYVRLGTDVVQGFMDVAATSGTISGLTTGATYDVGISAANSQGWRSVISETVRVVISNGADGNGDGLPDDWASANGVTDGNADSDQDGLSNSAEYQQGTHPLQQDSDADGLSDAEEKAAGSDPLDGTEFTAELSQPRLALATKRLSFVAKQQPGGEAAPQAILWSNTGGGTLALQATSTDAWLLPAVQAGTVQVSVDASNLAPGFYSGVVRLTAASGSDPLIGPPACIRVNAWVLRADDDTGGRQYLPLLARLHLLPTASAPAATATPTPEATAPPVDAATQRVRLPLIQRQ